MALSALRPMRVAGVRHAPTLTPAASRAVRVTPHQAARRLAPASRAAASKGDARPLGAASDPTLPLQVTEPPALPAAPSAVPVPSLTGLLAVVVRSAGVVALSLALVRGRVLFVGGEQNGE